METVDSRGFGECFNGLQRFYKYTKTLHKPYIAQQFNFTL